MEESWLAVEPYLFIAFYMALRTAVEQTYCSHVACDSE